MNDFVIFAYILGAGLAAALLAYKFIPQRVNAGPWAGAIPGLIIVLFGVYYTGLTCLNYKYFCTGGDLPIFLDIYENTAAGKFMISRVEQGSYNFLGHHFSPILILLVPFYKLWPAVQTLLIVQGLVFTAGAWPLYLLARNKTKSIFLAAAIAIGYLLAPLQLEDLVTDFHMDYFMPAFILFSVYFLQRKKWLLYFIFVFLLLASKIDACIYTAGIGLYAVFFARERKVGLLTIGLVGVYAWLGLGVIRPQLMGPDLDHHNWIYKRYGFLGEDLRTFIGTVFSRPLLLLRCFFVDNFVLKLRSLCFVLVPVAGLPLISAGGLVMLLPALAVMFLSSHWVQNSLMYHYSLAIYAFTFIAVVLACEKLPKRMFPAGGAFIIAAGILTHYFFSEWTFAGKFDNLRYSNSAKIKSAERVFRLIPAGSRVTCRHRYAVHLLPEYKVTVIKAVARRIPVKSEYILLDDQDSYSLSLLGLLYRGQYGVLSEDDYFILLKYNDQLADNEQAFRKIFGVLEGERTYTKIGRAVTDPQALNGRALFCGPKRKGIMAYGPYYRYPAGAYQVKFRLKTDNNRIGEPVVKLDVVIDHGRTVLAEKEISGRDFPREGYYTWFFLEFDHQWPEAELEFRLHYFAEVDIWLDRIEIAGDNFNLAETGRLNLDNEG